MKRRVVEAWALALLGSVGSVHCGGEAASSSQPATPASSAAAGGGRAPDPPVFASQVTATPIASGTAATVTPPPATTAPAESAPKLPAAKTVTLPLAARSGDPVDDEIVDADQLFEQGDLAGAL